MRLADFDYALPPERIAQTPAVPRDSARLLVLPRDGGALAHRTFADLPEYLRPGDVLVINDTRVLPARLIGRREPGGGRVELLLLRRLDADRWEALAGPGRKAKPGVTLSFGDGRLRASVEARTDSGGRIVRFVHAGVFEHVLDELGQMPLPPYIHVPLADRERYQTVYARHTGSAAAPTAGLHFTPELLARLEAQGVGVVRLTLHVGLGTFRPVTAERIEEHRIHSEWCSVSPEAAARINAARPAGGRIVAVGTTAARTLETFADGNGMMRAGEGWTEIFIYPGYRFKAVDALVTNFHLPKSSLLLLVSALAGRERVLAAYETAVAMEYRFFSFGDAMLIV